MVRASFRSCTVRQHISLGISPLACCFFKDREQQFSTRQGYCMTKTTTSKGVMSYISSMYFRPRYLKQSRNAKICRRQQPYRKANSLGGALEYCHYVTTNVCDLRLSVDPQSYHRDHQHRPTCSTIHLHHLQIFSGPPEFTRVFVAAVPPPA